MKYRKKPIIIEAVQFTPQTVMQMYKFINGETSVVLKSDIAHSKWDDYENSLIKNGYDFKTLESHGETQKAVIGDWIIKGVQGEFYPCKPDIFEKTYEAVSSHPEQGEQGELYRWQEIKSENDLPKEDGSYWCKLGEFEIEAKYRSAYKKFDYDVSHWMRKLSSPPPQDERIKELEEALRKIEQMPVRFSEGSAIIDMKEIAKQLINKK